MPVVHAVAFLAVVAVPLALGADTRGYVGINGNSMRVEAPVGHDVHITAPANGTVYINGVDVLAEMAGLSQLKVTAEDGDVRVTAEGNGTVYFNGVDLSDLQRRLEAVEAKLATAAQYQRGQWCGVGIRNKGNRYSMYLDLQQPSVASVDCQGHDPCTSCPSGFSMALASVTSYHDDSTGDNICACVKK